MTTPRFSGQYQKRIKQYTAAMAKEAQEAKPPEVPRKERIAAYKKGQKEAHLQAEKKYQLALQQFIENPAPVQQLMQDVLFTDDKGPFTGRDLLGALKESWKSQRSELRNILTLASILVIPLIDVYLQNYQHHGHENIFRFDGSLKNPFVESFPPPVQKRASQMVDQLAELGLILQSPNRLKIYSITPLGEQILAEKSKA